MQNLERYYGFRADVTTLLEPERLDQIRADALPILKFMGYNPAEYHVYCHQLRLTENPRRWASSIPLQRRINTLRLTFRVNPKQRQSGTIRFLNWRCEMSVEQQLGFLSGDVAAEGGSWDIHYNIAKEFVEGRTTFLNAIVTFVRRDVRPDHRKIKIELIATPTSEYETRLRGEQGWAETRLDLRLRSPIGWNATLLPPPEHRKGTSGAEATMYVLTELQRIEEQLRKARSAAVQLRPQTLLFPQQVAPLAVDQPQRRRLARIERLEREYGEVLERLLGTHISEEDVHAILTGLEQLLSTYENPLRAAGNPQLVEVLDKRHQLANPDRPLGSRLKLAIPVIPLLLHYEVELRPDGALGESWRRLKRVFGGRKNRRAAAAPRGDPP